MRMILSLNNLFCTIPLFEIKDQNFKHLWKNSQKLVKDIDLKISSTIIHLEGIIFDLELAFCIKNILGFILH